MSFMDGPEAINRLILTVFGSFWLKWLEIAKLCVFQLGKIYKSRLLFVSIQQYILNRDENPQLCNLFIQILQVQLIISTFKNAFP